MLIVSTVLNYHRTLIARLLFNRYRYNQHWDIHSLHDRTSRQPHRISSLLAPLTNIPPIKPKTYTTGKFLQKHPALVGDALPGFRYTNHHHKMCEAACALALKC